MTNTLGKIEMTTNLRKDTRQSDNLSDQAALALQNIRQLIIESPHSATLAGMVEQFRVALLRYNAGLSSDPARAAQELSAAMDALVHQQQTGKAFKSALSTPKPFLDRDRV